MRTFPSRAAVMVSSSRGRYRTFYRLFAPTFVVGIGLIYHQATILSVIRETSIYVNNGPDQYHAYINDLSLKTKYPKLKGIELEPQKEEQVNRIADIGQTPRKYNDKQDAQKRARENCQIVYVLGVEGVSHHGFEPIIKRLASIQVDPTSRLSYDLVMNDLTAKQDIQFALYGEQHFNSSSMTYRRHYMGFNNLGEGEGYTKTPSIDNPQLLEILFNRYCPPDDKKHVIIEWHSFPSGLSNQTRPFRVKRESAWDDMTSEEIAQTESAQKHPLNLTAFYETYSAYADIKFIVLHRPYLETIASHVDWFKSITSHSQVTRGFIYILRRFLDKHTTDLNTGEKLWHLVCIQHIFSKFYNHDPIKVNNARKNVIEGLAIFLNWPVKECADCYDSWHESKKDPLIILGDHFDAVSEHANSLKGIWPPASNDECQI